MSTISRRSPTGGVRRGRGADPLSAGEAAWLAATPCALLLVAVIALLAPPLGDAVLAPAAPLDFWRTYVLDETVRPEPTEHARYLLSLLGAPLVAGAMVLIRRLGVLRSPLTVALETGSMAVTIGFVVTCVAVQRTFAYDARYGGGVAFERVYFTPATLAVAAAIALALVAVLRRRAWVDGIARRLGDGRSARVAALALAALFTAVWLLSSFNTEGTIPNAHIAMWVNIPFWLDEAFSVLNGQGPLVDFNAQYGHLWAYVAAGAMALFGSSFGVYAATMTAGTAAGLLAIFGVLRRVAGSALLALALYLPFVAHGFFLERGPLENRYGPANLYSLFPMRYAGPYLLAWLTLRQLGSARAWPRALLFVAAGLVAINNLEFGLPALGATAVAVLLNDRPRSRPAAGRFLATLAIGLAGAVVVVCLLTLVVAGSLPHFGMLATFPRIYGSGGFGLLPMPAIGLHLVLYLTFAAALVVAIVRATAGDDDHPGLTGMLAWAGVFGLGASGYFVGRSHPDALINLFSAWALALALLLVAVVRTVVRRPSRRPRLAELLVLFGFGVAACSLAQTPEPTSQLDRLGNKTPEPVFTANATERYIARMTRPGEPVAIFAKLGHRIAHDIGVRNVTPYANLESMLTEAQWEKAVRALRAAGGRKIFLPVERLLQENVAWLDGMGFRTLAEAPNLGIVVAVDARRR
jgi:hypothetical protein